MASGVEMLGQMSQTDALAGPVQGGNMVVKPNEVPVGGAAMLAKAMRGQADRGVGGIYELPSQEPKEPQFMKIAMENLRSQMAELSPGQGGMTNYLGIQPLAKDAPRYWQSSPDSPPTELAYITDQEKQLLLQANLHDSLSAGVPNQGPDGIMSLDGMGQEDSDSPGKKSYSSGNRGRGEGQTRQSSYDTGRSSYDQDKKGYVAETFQDQERREQQTDRPGTGDFNTQANIEKAIQDTGARTSIRDIADTSKGNLQSDPEKVKQNIKQKNAEDRKTELDAKNDLTKDEKKEKSFLTKFLQELKDAATDGKNMLDDLIGGESKEEENKIKKKIKEMEAQIAAGDNSGTLRRKMQKLKDSIAPIPSWMKGLSSAAADFTGPNEDQFLDDNYLNILESKILKGYGTDKDGNYDRDAAIKAFAAEYDDRIPGQPIGPGGNLLGNENSLRMLLNKKGDIEQGSDLQKRLNPTEYWKNFKGSGTQGDMAELAGVSLQGLGSGPEDRRLAARIVAARDATSKRQDSGSNQNNRPQFMEQTIDNMEVMPGGTVVDEESQTMKYNSPRTGGKETSVPLQRRFRTDPTQEVAQYRTAPRSESDIYKYMTEGTTGEGIGLEPFSEYQRRRRKALGQEELELFN